MTLVFKRSKVKGTSLQFACVRTLTRKVETTSFWVQHRPHAFLFLGLLLCHCGSAQNVQCSGNRIWGYGDNNNLVRFDIGDDSATFVSGGFGYSGGLAIGYDIFNQVDTSLLIATKGTSVLYRSGAMPAGRHKVAIFQIVLHLGGGCT